MASGQSENGKVLPSEPKAPDVREVALRNFPADARTVRREFVDQIDALKKESKEAAKAFGDQKKKRVDDFNGDKIAMDIFDKLRVVTQERRDVILTQVAYLLDKLDMVGQRDLFNNIGQAGGLVNEKGDGKAVFDATKNNAAPRSSETEPVKKLTGAEPPAHVPTPGISNDEALAKFTEAKAAGDAKRAKKGAAPKPGAADAAPKPDSTPKPTEASKPAAAAAPKPGAAPKPSVRTPAAAAKPTATRMSRKPTADELAHVKKSAKSTADKYIPDPNAKDSDEGDASGNYRLQ